MSEKALDGRACFRRRAADREIFEALTDTESARSVPAPIFQANKSDRRAIKLYEKRRLRRRVGNFLHARSREDLAELTAA